MQNLSSLAKKYKYLAIIIFIFFTIESIWIITTPIFSTPDSQVRFKNIQNYAKGKNTPVISEPSPLYYSIAGNLDRFCIFCIISFFGCCCTLFKDYTVKIKKIKMKSDKMCFI